MIQFEISFTPTCIQFIEDRKEITKYICKVGLRKALMSIICRLVSIILLKILVSLYRIHRHHLRIYICVHSFLLFFFSLSLSSFISIILIAKHLSMKTFVIFDEYRYCEIYLEYH